MRPITSPTRLLLPALAAGALLFGACGDDDDSSATSDPSADTGSDTGSSADSGGGAAQDGPISVVEFAFDPMEINASAGQELTFENGDGTAHTATASDGSFNTGTIDAGASGTATAPDAPGEYPFICSFHPFMKGTVVVS